MGKMKSAAIDLANQKPKEDCDLPSAKYYQIYRPFPEYTYCCDLAKQRSCIQMLYDGGTWLFGPMGIENRYKTVYRHSSGITEYRKENQND